MNPPADPAAALPRIARHLRAWTLAGAAVLALPALAATAPVRGAGVAWQPAASDAEVDRAFALARASGKPVFLYWGAVWCPPCNQVKATLFSRPDFVERSRAFVPVYVDGDKPGAQKVASRFKVVGYPTMILFKPDGTELTRLPGEVDPQRYLLTLTQGLDAQVPVKALVATALARGSLTPAQWRLLAYYSWDTDEQQVLPQASLGQRLGELAQAVPADLPEVRDRLALKALVSQARAAEAGAKAAPKEGVTATAAAAPTDAGKEILSRVLAQPEAAREQADVLMYHGALLVRHAAPTGPQRRALAAQLEGVLTALAQEPGRSRGERIDTLDTRLALWRVIDGAPELTAARRAAALREVAQLVAATTDRYERQAVIPSAAHVLAEAGLVAESDELLRAELPRAVAPYYHMLGLAANAKKRGDSAAALDWYEQAWRRSEGPATRIQWGVTYVSQVMALRPDDVARVERAASALVAQLQPRAETFYERNQRSLQRLATRLGAWQAEPDMEGRRPAAVQRIRAQLDKTCARLPDGQAGKANCQAVFAQAGKPGGA